MPHAFLCPIVSGDPVVVVRSQVTSVVVLTPGVARVPPSAPGALDAVGPTLETCTVGLVGGGSLAVAMPVAAFLALMNA